MIFHCVCFLLQDEFLQADAVRDMGDKLIEDEHYAVDCIRPKCIELQRICEQYRELLRARYEILNKSRDLQDRIDKVRKWLHVLRIHSCGIKARHLTQDKRYSEACLE